MVNDAKPVALHSKPTSEAPVVLEPEQEPKKNSPVSETGDDRLSPRLYKGLWYLDFPEDRGGFFGSGN